MRPSQLCPRMLVVKRSGLSFSSIFSDFHSWMAASTKGMLCSNPSAIRSHWKAFTFRLGHYVQDSACMRIHVHKCASNTSRYRISRPPSRLQELVQPAARACAVEAEKARDVMTQRKTLRIKSLPVIAFLLAEA